MLFDSPGLVEQPVKLAMHFHHDVMSCPMGKYKKQMLVKKGGGGVDRWLVGLDDCSRPADFFKFYYFTLFKILYSAV